MIRRWYLPLIFFLKTINIQKESQGIIRKEIHQTDLIILEIEGRGAHGKVVKAFHKKERKYYAIKEAEIDQDNKALAEFQISVMMREVDAMIALNRGGKCPNVISYIDHSIEKDANGKRSFLIVMEHAICSFFEILNWRIDKGGQYYYYVHHTIYIMQMLINGLMFAKKMSICHRDIKPGNILVDCGKLNMIDESDLNYKLADWGEGKFIRAEDAGKERKHSYRGTEGYMAPELLKYFTEQGFSKKYSEYDPFKADVYALGKVFEKLIQRTKFEQVAKKLEEKLKQDILANMVHQDALKR